MSPRKSSTSSANHPTRPRYLGLVAPRDGPRWSFSREWEQGLSALLRAADAPDVRFRLIRQDGPRAVVEVAQTDVSRALGAWTRGGDPDSTAAPPRLESVRTWGTLRGAKAWLKRRP